MRSKIFDGYSDHSACWIIKPATRGYRVEITTEEFDIESHFTCFFDVLSIRCGYGTYPPVRTSDRCFYE